MQCSGGLHGSRLEGLMVQQYQELSDMFLVFLLDRVRPNCVPALCNVCFRMILHVMEHTLTKILISFAFTAT